MKKILAISATVLATLAVKGVLEVIGEIDEEARQREEAGE